MHLTFNRDAQQGNSESREHSQNSRKKQAAVDRGNVNVTVSNRDKQSLAGVSDFLEHFQNSLPKDGLKLKTGEVNGSSSDHDGQCLETVSKF